MKVIATTSQSVLVVDCSTGRGSVLHRGSGLYYGIARIESGFAIAARRRLVSSLVPRPDERGCILVFDGNFRESSVLEAPFPLRDVHQIAWFDRRLWVTCSHDDQIAIWDGVGWERWLPEGTSATDGDSVEPDRYHYNSFYAAGDEFAVVAHNHGPSIVHFFGVGTRSWRRSMPLGNQAHNLWREGDAYVTCSSIEGRLVADTGWELRTGGFPRGVACTSSERAIGISALRERGQRDWMSAAIAIYDTSWRLSHYVHLVREGMLLDLEPIPDTEFVAAETMAIEAFRSPILTTLSAADLQEGQDSSGNESR